MIDETDRTILEALQTNARTANAEIARQLGMAPSAILERIRKLESRGVIRGFSTDIDPQAIGLGQLAFIFVRADECPGQVDVGECLTRVPEVLEVHHVAGEDCYLVKVRTADTASLGAVLRHQIGAIPRVASTRTTVVMETLKESPHLPLAPPKPPAERTAALDRSES
jgi:Lrp/AsnC family leucine-responsive transcriptional regulator